MTSVDSIEDWLAKVYHVNPFHVNFGLSRLKSILKKFPLQHFDIPVITVTGTNGKGSTVAYLSNILIKCGYRVGAFTSPHILRFNERIQLNGHSLSDERLCQAFAMVESYRGEVALTFFEYAFLAALTVFQAEPLDVLVLEVGAGGLEDAVNCVDADLSVITSIDLDHQRWLGDTRADIATQKVGIMRAGKPLICGDPNPPIAVFSAAERLASPLYLNGREYGFEVDEKGWNFRNETLAWGSLDWPHLPVVNAATALQVLSVLSDRFTTMEWALRECIRDTQLVGRMQALPDGVSGFMDVAHNPQSVAYLAQKLEQEPITGKTHALFSMLNDKDIHESIKTMIPLVDEWTIAVLASERSASLDDMVAVLNEYGVQKIHIQSDIASAFRQLSRQISAQDRLIAFGSFHVVAEILQQ